MTDPSAQLRDYIDGVARVLTEHPSPSAPTWRDGRRAGGGRRTGVVLVLAVALVAGVALIGIRRGDADRSVVTTDRTLFVPPVSTQGGKTRLPLVFPDGTTVDLVYPSSYNLAQLGFEPEAAVNYSPYGTGPDRPDAASPSPCCSRGLTIKRGTIGEVFGGRAPTKVYVGARGQDVPFFDSTVIDSVADLPQLAFQFGSWTVLAWDYAPGDPRGTRMTDEQRAVFASSLDGHEDKHGFLRLEPQAPLCLQTLLDGPNGTLGRDGPDATPVWLYLQRHLLGGDGAVTVKTQRGYDIVRSGALVVPGQRFEVVLPDRLRGLQDSLEIRNFREQGAWRC
jgi:hypothetical protein